MMTRRTALLTIASALTGSLGGCVTATRPVLPPDLPASPPGVPGPALDAALHEVVVRSGARDLSAAVLRPGGAIRSGGTGRGAEAWGSVTKMPVAAAAVALEEAGVWRLSDPVGRHVTGLPGATPSRCPT